MPITLLQHLHACNRVTKIFLGREDEMNHIKEYILGDVRQPLTLYGESGCGKTAVLAKAYANVRLDKIILFFLVWISSKWAY